MPPTDKISGSTTVLRGPKLYALYDVVSFFICLLSDCSDCSAPTRGFSSLALSPCKTNPSLPDIGGERPLISPAPSRLQDRI
ncbi:hypothetical protein L2E82_25941 [Cichorium intybus]|uniref:Uncharacterized protein n=1 Tax=Cichorium intybus TaxID=13427 RepID=A0ACB9E523_CICIN|nr:hypothetical protein L2E82_25941 [Cichorium intybus]